MGGSFRCRIPERCPAGRRPGSAGSTASPEPTSSNPAARPGDASGPSASSAIAATNHPTAIEPPDGPRARHTARSMRPRRHGREDTSWAAAPAHPRRPGRAFRPDRPWPSDTASVRLLQCGMIPRAITFDFWNTLYTDGGSPIDEIVDGRLQILRGALDACGGTADDEQLADAYRSGFGAYLQAWEQGRHFGAREQVTHVAGATSGVVCRDRGPRRRGARDRRDRAAGRVAAPAGGARDHPAAGHRPASAWA